MKQALREHLKTTCSDQELASWFDPLNVQIAEQEKQVTVAFPHGFFARWFEGAHQDRFEALLNKFLGTGYVINYMTHQIAKGNGNEPQTVTQKVIDFPFGSQFIFETFLLNKKNYFPLASAKEVTKQPAHLFNPFIICGKSGAGKTHLMRAVANEMAKRSDPKKILLLSLDDLKTLYDVTFAGEPLRARDYIFSHDSLFVDDFHQIQKYDSMQPEMIILFNHFFDNKKQMIFCCQDKITSYDFLEPNLLSRLEWGLIVNLKQPDLEIRIAYIRETARTRRLPLTKEQILTLAQRFKDFRYLQGILIKLFAFRELVRKDLSKKDFEHILNNTEERTTDTLKPEQIIQVVADDLSVSVKDIQGGKRHAPIAQARQIAMYLCKKLLPISYPALGRAFGGKDHSTVLYSVKKIEQLSDDDNDLNALLKELKKKCLLAGKN